MRQRRIRADLAHDHRFELGCGFRLFRHMPARSAHSKIKPRRAAGLGVRGASLQPSDKQPLNRVSSESASGDSLTDSRRRPKGRALRLEK
jgi:hypothetical protein